MINYGTDKYIRQSNSDHKISIQFDYRESAWKLCFDFNSGENKGDWLFIVIPIKTIDFQSGYWIVKDNVITDIITDFLDGKFNGHEDLREKMNDTLMNNGS